MIYLKEVDPKSEDHIFILFEILNKRKYSISHKEFNSIDEHTDFVRNHPYRKWLIVFKDKLAIGSIYCTYENVLGINLIIHEINLYKELIIKITSFISPLPPKPSIRNKKFTINVPPENNILQQALSDLSAIPIQLTYLLN